MKRICLLFVLITFLNTASGQVIKLQYMVDSSIGLRNDTARLFDSWCNAGYCGADWLFGNSSEFLAFGDYDKVRKVITRYMGMFVRFGKDQYEFRNRCIYYCTADKSEYDSWHKEVEMLGFRFQEKKVEEYAESSIYSKGLLYITLRRDMKKYRIWQQSDRRKDMLSREYEASDDKTPSYIAFVELKPVVLVDQLFDYFSRYRDTTVIKHSLFDRGYAISIKDDRYLNILGIGDDRESNYNESLSLSLSKSAPALIYQTDYEFLFKTWEPWLIDKGFKGVEVSSTNIPGERYFQKDNTLVGLAKMDKGKNGIGYRLFIKKLN